MAANATARGDTIVLRARTYALTRVGEDDDALAGDLDVTPGSGALTIAGKRRAKTRIRGNGADRIFDVLAGARLSLRRLTLAGGNASHGGAIRNAGRLALRNAALRRSEASFGGGVFNTGAARMTATRTLFAGNKASFGGGVFDNNDSTVVLTRTVFRDNETDGVGGGAIFNQNDSNLLVRQSTIDRNHARGDDNGGGIFNQNRARARIVSSTISRNTAVDDGGGIHAANESSMRVINSTVSGNRADRGGGVSVRNQAKLALEFTTIATNRATSAGGGVFEELSPPGPPPPPYITFRGTIVAANSAPGPTANCAIADPGNVRSEGSNLESSNSCLFGRASDRPNARARLRPLARNGGPTRTHALKRTSNAVNAARRKGCPKRDQRGVKRPQGRRCDIGSFELKR